MNKMVREPKHTDVRDQIDENLRRVFSQTADAEIPERFLKLIEELRRRDRLQKDRSRPDEERSDD